MQRKTINSAEIGMNQSLDRKPGQNIPESIITTNAQEALHRNIELLADNFVNKTTKMKEMVLKDLHLSRHGTSQQVEDARTRLVKFGIPKSDPIEILALIESRFKEIGLNVASPDYQKDSKYKDFHNLFKGSKEIQ